MTISSVAQRQLSDGNSQGNVLGQSATDLIGFYGVTSCVARPTTHATTNSISSGALASSIAAALNALGLVLTSSFAA